MTKRGGTGGNAGKGDGDAKRRGPVPPEMRLAIEEACREAIASGVGSRNSIARAFEVGVATVTRICKAAQPPIEWDRAATKAAVEAKVIDSKARRQALAEGLLDDIDHIRTMIRGEVKRVHYSVANGRQEYNGPPTANEIKDLFIAAGIALDKHAMLSRFDSDDRDLSSVDQWMEHIMGGGVS